MWRSAFRKGIFRQRKIIVYLSQSREGTSYIEPFHFPSAPEKVGLSEFTYQFNILREFQRQLDNIHFQHHADPMLKMCMKFLSSSCTSSEFLSQRVSVWDFLRETALWQRKGHLFFEPQVHELRWRLGVLWQSDKGECNCSTVYLLRDEEAQVHYDCWW